MDIGPGIRVEDRERIFDRFYQREDSGEVGIGPGLAIVKTIANLYNVTITLGRAKEGGILIRIGFKKKIPGIRLLLVDTRAIRLSGQGITPDM